jgi:hypothetical protein
MQAGPGVGTATLTWDFGYIRRAETRTFQTFTPYYLNRMYVAVETLNKWGAFQTWVGVVENEQVRPWGNATLTTGEQTFTAYELHHLLDRYPIRGAYVNNGLGGGTQYIKENLVFNGSMSGRSDLFANQLVGGGVFFVGPNSVFWSDWDILNYVFNNYVNAAFGITFEGLGEAQVALQTSYRRLDPKGMTPKQILDTLVDRRRGLGYTIQTNGAGTVYIYVFSQLAEATGAGYSYVPANENQAVLWFAGYRDAEVEYSFGEVTHYDEVVVEGGNVFTTGTVSIADGTLEPAWDSTEETDYKDADIGDVEIWRKDAYRREEQFDNVFQGFRVPSGWDAFLGDGIGGEQYNALPSVDLDGQIYPDIQAAAFRAGKRFERDLPWESPLATSTSEPEYAKAFAVCSFPDPDFVDDPEDEEDAATTLYAFTEVIEKLKMRGTSLELADGLLGMTLRPTINHTLALNHWDTEVQESEEDPKLDYETLMLTARFKTDEKLGVYSRIPTSEFLETGKTKVIYMPECRAEYVVPGTVSGVVDGELVRAYSGLLRDDTYRIYMAAAMAVSWYGQVRATLAFRARGISVAYGVGTLIAATEGPEGVTQVGTPVTSVQWNFTPGQQGTSWQTGFSEMDFAESFNG